MRGKVLARAGGGGKCSRVRVKVLACAWESARVCGGKDPEHISERVHCRKLYDMPYAVGEVVGYATHIHFQCCHTTTLADLEGKDIIPSPLGFRHT